MHVNTQRVGAACCLPTKEALPPMSDSTFRVVVDCRSGSFALRGDLDQRSAEGLRATVAAARLPIVVLDLSDLRAIDSAGIACIAAAAQHHSRVVLRGVGPEHRDLVAALRGRPGFIFEGQAPEASGTDAHPMTSVLSVSGLGPLT